MLGIWDHNVGNYSGPLQYHPVDESEPSDVQKARKLRHTSWSLGRKRAVSPTSTARGIRRKAYREAALSNTRRAPTGGSGDMCCALAA